LPLIREVFKFDCLETVLALHLADKLLANCLKKRTFYNAWPTASLLTPLFAALPVTDVGATQLVLLYVL